MSDYTNIALLVLYVLFGVVKSINDDVNNDLSCKDGNCDLHLLSEYRLKFLGGYNDTSKNSPSSQMCYKYKLHKHKNNNEPAPDNHQNDVITWSIKICNENSEYGVLSDYLTKVLLPDSNDNDAYYYIDDNSFYYVSKDNNNNDKEIELCFSSPNNDNINDVEVITNTTYCIQHNNDSKLCSDRGIYVTDICGLDSKARSKKYLPAASIDYIPIPGKSYNLRKESRERGLMKGHGNYDIHDSLVVLRAWWIDDCQFIKNNKYMKVELNDIYFNDINNNNINEFDDLLDSPLTLPIYDHFIVKNECQDLHGIIAEYEHNSKSEKLVLYVDIEEVSPLMFFNDAKVNIDNMVLLDVDDDDKLYNNGTTNSSLSVLSLRRRLKKASLNTKLEVEMPEYSVEKDIYVKGRDIGTCGVTITPFFNFIVGLSFDYSYKTKKSGGIPYGIKASLNRISGRIGVEAGISASLSCLFGEDSEDGEISYELLSKDFKMKKYRASIGPLVLTAQPFIEFGAVLTRPGISVEIGTEVDFGSISVVANAGWDKKDGAFVGFEKEFNQPSLNLIPPDLSYPGQDGSLSSSFAISVSPGINFGLYNNDLLYIKAPIYMPYVEAYMKIQDVCSNGFKLQFGVDFNFAISLELGIYPIKLWRINLYDGYSWNPNKPLYSKSLGTATGFPKNFGCKSKDEVNSDILFPDLNYDSFIYKDYPYVLIVNNGEYSDRLNWYSANAYCSFNFNSTLATPKTENDEDDIFNMLTKTVNYNDFMILDPKSQDYFDELVSEKESFWSKSDFYPLIGVKYDNNKKNYRFVDDNSYYSKNINQWICPYSGNCKCSVFFPSYEVYRAQYPAGIYGSACRDYEPQGWMCNLNDIHNENNKYIGVYAYNNYKTFNEANNYCHNKFGTELATILNDYDNTDAWESVKKISDKNKHIIIDRAYIGLNNIMGENDFTFVDGRDSSETGYTNWWTNQPNNNNGNQDCGEFYDTSSEWNDIECNKLLNAFVCNRPNVFDNYEYYNFIGVEALNYPVNSIDANHICEEEFGTTLASIHSNSEQEEINYIISHLEWDKNDYSIQAYRQAIIGLTDGNNEGTFEWEDGTYVSYTNWDPSEPNNWQGVGGSEGQDCTGIKTTTNLWHDFHCNLNHYYYFICNRPKTEYFYGDYVGINTHDENNGYTWQEAEFYCNTHYNTHLASIHSNDQVDASEIVYDNIDGVYTWIGFNDIINEDSYIWSDGSTNNFVNWYVTDDTTQPNNWQNDQDCAEIRYRDSGDYRWNDRKCENKLTSFICNRPIKTETELNYIGVNLFNNYGNGLDWYQANDYCKNTYGTVLATNIGDDNTKGYDAVFSIWESLEVRKSRKSSWIGLTDIDNEGTWKWIDDSGTLSTSDSHWRSGQPNNYDGNQDCIVLSDNGIEDNGCDSQYPSFFCNRPISTYFNKNYISINTYNNLYSYNDANNYCLNKFDTTLATNIDDNNVESYDLLISMMDMVEINDNDYSWIGATNSENGGNVEYNWEDGSGVLSTSDSHWKQGEPSNSYTEPECVAITSSSGLESVICNDYQLSSFFCNNKYTVIPLGTYYGVYTYGNNNKQLNFIEANNYCSQYFGTQLATIDSIEDMEDIESLSYELDELNAGGVSFIKFVEWIDYDVIDDIGTSNIELPHDINTLTNGFICGSVVKDNNNNLLCNDELWNEMTGTWIFNKENIDNNDCSLSIDENSNSYDRLIWIGSEDGLYFNQDYNYLNFVLTIKLSPNGGKSGVYFRCLTTGNNDIQDGEGYYFSIDSRYNKIQLYKVDYGYTTLKTKSESINNNEIYTIKIIGTSNGIYDFYINGELMWENIELNDFMSGSIGLRVWKDYGTFYSVKYEKF